MPDRRYYDRDGRLHIASQPISKASVSPYRGVEIPGWRELMLDPDRVYRVLRPDGELAKVGKSVSLPIVSRHVPVATDIDRGLIVGAATSPRFSDPYLLMDVAFWSGRAIDAIERRTKRDLSLGYDYRCVPVSGIFAGEPYSLVMRDIRPHHVALSRQSRVSGMALDSSWFLTPARAA